MLKLFTHIRESGFKPLRGTSVSTVNATDYVKSGKNIICSIANSMYQPQIFYLYCQLRKNNGDTNIPLKLKALMILNELFNLQPELTLTNKTMKDFKLSLLTSFPFLLNI